MQLILPDVLAAAADLSAGAAGFLVAVGVLLWAAGWRWHRFWIVFGITLAAGLVGLGAGQAAGNHQVLVVGVLLAVAAGMLALELARLLAFVTGGTTAWVATQSVFPQAQELWAVFLSGGLIGVVLYPLWTMLTTSFCGVLLTWHAGFVLVSRFADYDAPGWVAAHAAALNGGVIAVTVIGVVVQSKTNPKELAAADHEEHEEKHAHAEKETGHGPKEPAGHGKKATGWLRGMVSW